jgi:hypothetical protein
MPRRDGEVFLFGTAIGSNSWKGADYRFEAGLIEEGRGQS